MQGQVESAQPTLVGDQFILLDEISHRVVNEYSSVITSIARSASTMSDEGRRGVLEDAMAQLCRYAEAHRALQRPLGVNIINLGDYLERLGCSLCDASLAERGVRLVLQIDSLEFGVERCWKVGLICAELITNSVRHGLKGRPGAILIQLSLEGDQVLCSVLDTGGASPCRRPGHGSRVLQNLAQQLGGHIEWRFSARAVEALLQFPAERTTLRFDLSDGPVRGEISSEPIAAPLRDLGRLVARRTPSTEVEQR